MYKIGDYVAHYKEGICEVTDIGKLNMSFSDKQKEYYTLKPVYDAAGTLYTPVTNERKQIRDVITVEEAEALINEIADIEVIRVEEERKREARYKEELLKNECRAWISIIKTSYGRKMKRLSSGKKAVSVDDRYMAIAEKFLYGELAVVFGMSIEEVKKYILERAKQ